MAQVEDKEKQITIELDSDEASTPDDEFEIMDEGFDGLFDTESPLTDGELSALTEDLSPLIESNLTPGTKEFEIEVEEVPQTLWERFTNFVNPFTPNNDEVVIEVEEIPELQEFNYDSLTEDLKNYPSVVIAPDGSIIQSSLADSVNVDTSSEIQFTQWGAISTIGGEQILSPTDETNMYSLDSGQEMSFQDYDISIQGGPEQIDPDMRDSRIENEVTTSLEETQEIIFNPEEMALINELKVDPNEDFYETDFDLDVANPASNQVTANPGDGKTELETKTSSLEKSEINMESFDTFPGAETTDFKAPQYYHSLQQSTPKEVYPRGEYQVVPNTVEDPFSKGHLDLPTQTVLPEWNNDTANKNLNPAEYYNSNAYYFVTHEAKNINMLLKNPTLPISVSPQEILENSTKRAAVEAQRDKGLISENRYLDILRDAHRGQDVKLYAHEIIAFGLIGYQDADKVLQTLKNQKEISSVEYNRFATLNSITPVQHQNGIELGGRHLAKLNQEVDIKNKEFEQVLSGSKKPLVITKDQITNTGLRSAAEDVAKDHSLIHVDRYQSIMNRLQSDGVAKMWPEEAVAFGLFSNHQAKELLNYLHKNGDITAEQKALEPPQEHQKELGKNIYHASMVKLGMTEFSIDDFKLNSYLNLDEARYHSNPELAEPIAVDITDK